MPDSDGANPTERSFKVRSHVAHSRPSGLLIQGPLNCFVTKRYYGICPVLTLLRYKEGFCSSLTDPNSKMAFFFLAMFDRNQFLSCPNLYRIRIRVNIRYDYCGCGREYSQLPSLSVKNIFLICLFLFVNRSTISRGQYAQGSSSPRRKSATSRTSSSTSDVTPRTTKCPSSIYTCSVSNILFALNINTGESIGK